MATLQPKVQQPKLNDAQIATQNGYNKANYQSGYGIGDSTNVTGGFGRFNDSNALRTEIGRVETVLGNRTNYGLDNSAFDSYYGKLQNAYQPFTTAQNNVTAAQNKFDTSQTAARSAYDAAFNQFNDQIAQANSQATQGPGYTGYVQSLDQTIGSIADKYGFTFNRDSARQQAEAEAQRLRDANADQGRRNTSNNQLNNASIDASILNAVEGLDRNYFQQGLAQQQNQVNSGLNAGIAADQALRLQFNRQAELGDVYRDANLGRQQEQQRFTNEDLRLADALGTINQGAVARENELANQYEQQLYNVIAQDRDFYLNAANSEFDQSQALVNQYLAQQGVLTNNFNNDRTFDYSQLRDAIGDSQFDRQFAQGQFETAQAKANLDRQFNYDKSQDTAARNAAQQALNYQQLLDAANLTGNFGGQRTLAGQAADLNQREFGLQQELGRGNLQLSQAELAQRNQEFNSLSAAQKVQFEQNASQFGEDLAFQLLRLESGQELERTIAEAELRALTGQGSTGNSNSNYSAGGGNIKSTNQSVPISLGTLSSKYESSGNPGTVARTKGDIGGASYGTYQLTTASGQAQKFANQYGGSLKGLKAGTTAFDNAFKAEAKKNPTAFAAAQEAFIQKSHYEPSANAFTKATGINANTQSDALKNVLFSIGVQHGSGGAANIYKRAGINKADSQATIIKKLYAERSKVDTYFKSSPANIKKSVYNRFQRELQDALNLL